MADYPHPAQLPTGAFPPLNPNQPPANMPYYPPGPTGHPGQASAPVMSKPGFQNAPYQMSQFPNQPPMPNQPPSNQPPNSASYSRPNGPPNPMYGMPPYSQAPPGVRPSGPPTMPPQMNGMSAQKPTASMPPMMNGPPSGVRPQGPVAPPPSVSMAPQASAPPPMGSAPPPMGSAPPSMGSAPPSMGSAPPSMGSAPPSMGSAPPMMANHHQSPPQMQPPPSSMAGGPPPNAPPQMSRPGELPVPFHGQAQYSHQVHDHSRPGLTPGSGPPSQKSSRAPSPVPETNYDAMEGQFSPMSAGSPADAQNKQATPPAPAGITGRRQYPQMPSYGQQPPAPQPGPPGPPAPMPGSGMQPQYAQPPATQPLLSQHPGNHQLNSQFSNMKLQPDNLRPVNLLQERQLIPPEGVASPKVTLPNDLKKVNCHPDIFRCTLNSIPNTQSLLNKSRLPLGILIHPFKDLAQLPVIQSSVIVRCRTCRTYINPFVVFVDMRRWKCNLCYRVNELPEEFNYDPVSKTYGEPQRRPEIQSATIEFIAPSEYMLRPPQPAVYLYALDVSFNAVNTGYLQVFCQALIDELERIPGDNRTQIGFLAYDRSLHFFNLAEGLSQPQMLVVSDVEDICLPRPDSLLVNLQESKEMITDLLHKLPLMFEGNTETGSALGPALQAAYKLMSSTGGRVTVCQTQLPSVGPGALKCREDPNERAGRKIQNLGPATDFYKKLALDCSAQQIAVDLFMLNSQYADVATVAGISKYSGGCLEFFRDFHTVSNPAEADRFESSLRRYFTRKIGFEAVMRIRCTRGLSIHTFHGNFFVRSTDLLSLPNINPDAGFGMQMSIEDNLECNQVCFQAALLYTSSKGERRIRVHTLCLPVTNGISEIYSNADQQAIVGLLSKMGVDKSLTQSMGDARDAMINAAVDMLGAYGQTLTSSQRMGQLPCPFSLRLMPTYILALTKSIGFRVGASTKLDDRVFGLEDFKSQPLFLTMLQIYPNLYPVHALDDNNALNKNDVVIPQPPLLHLSSANIDRHGAYLMDTGSHFFLWLGAAISDRFCSEVFGVPNFVSIPEISMELPELDNPTSDRLRIFIGHLQEQKPYAAPLLILREDCRQRHLFIERLVEDRSESTHSYYEFLQHLQKEVKS